MLNGKTIMSWNVPAVEGGDPEKFVKLLVENKFEGVMLKAGNGNAVHNISRFSPWPLWGENIRIELVNALKAAGLKVILWHFLYGVDPTGEANIAISQTARFEPDGYVWDVEGAFDTKTNAEANARLITKLYQKTFPTVEQGLCWWAFPKSPTTGSQWHPVKVGQAFLEICQVGLPMMYWQGSTPVQAVKYLNDSLRIWHTITKRPIIPIGRAYNGDGGYANSPSIVDFGYETYYMKDQGNTLPGCSWWSLDKAVGNSEWMAALKSLPKYRIDGPPVLSIEEKVDRLVEAHPELFPELYEE